MASPARGPFPRRSMRPPGGRRPARSGRPPGGGGALGCGRPRLRSDDSPRSQPGAVPATRATRRQTTAARCACPFGRAPGTRRWWSLARGAETALHGQSFPSLRAAAFQHRAAALCLHPLPEAMRLLPAALVGLKRALHERVPFRSSSRRSVGSPSDQVNPRADSEDACDDLLRRAKLRHPQFSPGEVLASTFASAGRSTPRERFSVAIHICG